MQKESDNPPQPYGEVDARIFNIATQIAEQANECCNRSDGYEHSLARLAYHLIHNLVQEKINATSNS